MTPDELVAELYEARVEQGLSVTDLARLAGVGDSTIDQYERHQRRPRLDLIVALADALGLEVVVQPKSRGRSR